VIWLTGLGVLDRPVKPDDDGVVDDGIAPHKKRPGSLLAFRIIPFGHAPRRRGIQ
jgi:hypothetical protein